MRTTLTAAALLLAVLLAGCGGSQQTVQSGSESDPSGAGEATADASGSQSPAASAATGQGGAGQTPSDGSGHGHSGPVEVPANAQTRQVEGTEFAFEPADLTVEVGRPVAVTLTNAGEVQHEWVLLGDDGSEIAHAHAQPGAEATAVFTLDQPGTYEVRCTVPGHAEQGMVGTVTAS